MSKAGWYEICMCKYRPNAGVCNNKQHWNNEKCRCECKRIIDKGICDKGFIWNPSNCKCECDKSCDIGKYLDYKNCKCRTKIVHELVEERSENIDESEMIYNATLNDNENVYGSCTIYTILFVIVFL